MASVFFVHFFTYHDFTPQLLLYLNLSGSLLFVFCLALQHVNQTWPCLKYQTPSTWYVLSCATTDGRIDWLLMRLLNAVVFGAIVGCNNNRCDSDLSLFGPFCISL
jgi:hypothetical protein